MYTSKSKKTDQKGSSLIEVMVALFVLAIGLLGVLSMQVKSMQYSQSAFQYTMAMQLANDILENIRSNSIDDPAFDFSDYYIADDAQVNEPEKDCTVAGVACTPTEMRNHDLYEWRENVRNTLIAGRSSIVETPGGNVAITIFFDDSRSDAVTDDNAELAQFVLVTGF